MSTILCILDGFGIGNLNKFNPMSFAKANFLKSMMDVYPSSKLNASGTHVGLMDGQIGNSEIGHLTIGSGRIIDNDFIRINNLIKTIANSREFCSFISNIVTSGGKCHIIGLLSDGGVHSHYKQLYKLVDYVIDAGIEPCLHIITDGRDVSPCSIKNYLHDEYISFICTIIGRYYAMDRDKRWDRTQLAYDLIVNSVGDKYGSVNECIDSHYQKNITDEFILPSVIGNGNYKININDGIIVANFRSDRAKQITSHIVQNAKFCDIISLTKYSDDLNIKTLIEPIYIKNSLGEVISNNNLKQLRIAETEKYAHVTYFFNGRIEKKMKGEERILVDSPKVTTYDLSPAMSAHMITENLIFAIRSKKFDFILVNYANADMLGHTGNMDVAIQTIEILDSCVLKIVELIKNTKDTLIITSDHGNIELMYDQKNMINHTAHTLNPVPFVILGKDNIKKVYDGNLYDIAPTILFIMGLSAPKEMCGKNLLECLES